MRLVTHDEVARRCKVRLEAQIKCRTVGAERCQLAAGHRVGNNHLWQRKGYVSANRLPNSGVSMGLAEQTTRLAVDELQPPAWLTQGSELLGFNISAVLVQNRLGQCSVCEYTTWQGR